MKQQLKELQAYQPGLSPRQLKEKYGIEGDMVKLASNENLYGPSPKVKDAIQESIDELFYYPEVKQFDVKDTLSQFLNVKKEQIFFVSGLDEVIMIISRAVLEADDEILTSDMTFGQYKHHAVIERAQVKTTPLNNGYFDLDAMYEEITDKTKLIWICNPNNPSGTYLPHEELESFIKKVPDNIIVLIDEAYIEFAVAEDMPRSLELLDKYKQVVVLRTFSKAYGLASQRIGYAIADESLLNQLDIVRLPFNVTSLSAVAANAALQDQEYLKDITNKNRTEIEKFLNSSFKEHLYDSQTNFVFVNTDKPQELYDQLLKEGFITRPFPNGVRITVGFSEHNDKMIKVLETFFEKVNS